MAGGGWSSLPADFLRLVSSRLTSADDVLHVRQVCHHWRAPVPVAPFRPWVVATRAKPIRVGPLGDCSHWLPAGLKRVQLATPPGLPYCCGTPRGWLALADDERSPTRLVLWEPRSGAEIPLPPLACVVQVFISADPLASSSSSWLAVATQVRSEFHRDILFWRPGDRAWSAAADRVYTSERLHSVAFLGGKMYCMDYSKRLAIYGLNLGTNSPPMLLQSMHAVSLLNMLCNRRCGKKLHGTRAAHFVSCNDELLLVVLFNNGHPSFAEPPLEFGERLEDLGGYSLFLGRGDAFALSPQEFPAIKRNCIYYAVHFLNVQIKDWVFVFNLESDVLEEFPFPTEHKEDPANTWWPVSWFCPKRPIFRSGSKAEANLDAIIR
ncbi:hypothetical protein SETIT_9G348100v2 [Setaria italica]|uniref:KIB1-4 beta-propeller domain-containing protein n=1 Tax=Setaria italica TaxID=4555 RepID=K4ABC6_SETIT|nr:hypothetical protein SETIT_9G348100v2 [Setaria italica]